MEHREIRVIIPAVVANVGCGWHLFAYAVETPIYEIFVRLEKNGSITCNHPRAAAVAAEYLKKQNSSEGCLVELHDKIPAGSGLSSVDSIPIGVLYALNNLFNSPLTPIELLQFLETEQPAMAAAALIGGFVLVRQFEPLDIVEIPCQVELYTALVRPDLEIPAEIFTAKKEIPMEKWLSQSGNAAALTAGLALGRDDIFAQTIKDELFESSLASFIPGYNEIKSAALKAGALGVGIAGDGPTLFAISHSPAISLKAGQAMAHAFQAEATPCQLYLTKINFLGITPYPKGISLLQ